MKTLWIECYEKCGCSFGPVPRRDLPGYCAKHGNNWKAQYKVRAVEQNDKINELDLELGFPPGTVVDWVKRNPPQSA